jgi:hypothetical protein
VNDPVPELPPGARRVLERDLEGIEQLEVVLLLRRYTDRYWDAEMVAHRVGLPVQPIVSALEALARRGFLDVRLAGSIKYRYSPAAPEQREAMDAIASLWRTSRAVVLDAFTTKRQALRDFSDAFRLGKDTRRG